MSKKGDKAETCLDLRVDSSLLGVVFLVVVWVESDVVEGKLLLYSILESLSLLESKGIGLGDDGDDVDSLTELLQDDNVDWFEGVASGLNEVKAAVDPGILDVAVALSSELLAQVCRVLVLDVFHDRIPAAVVVHEITVTRGVDDVQTKADTVLFNDVGDRVDLGSAANRLGGSKATLGVDQVRSEHGVDEGGFAETGLS